MHRHVNVPLSQGHFDALTSFTFNLGAGALQQSTLLAKLNAGDYGGAQAQFGRWVYTDGQVLQGLVDRRAAEAAMFGGEAPSGTDSAGTPVTKEVETTRATMARAADTVQRGDTLFAMTREHGVSLQSLIAANLQIANPNLIHAGQQVQLPGGAAAVSDTTGGGPGGVTAVDGEVSLAGAKTVQGYIRGQASTIEVVPVGQGEYLRADAAQAYLQMRKDAAAAGFNLTATSGFRSNEEQQVLYQRHLNGTGNLAAQPGFSNHQSGISIDIGGSLAGYDTAAFAWLQGNAAAYGFVNDVRGEWWHWTFKP